MSFNSQQKFSLVFYNFLYFNVVSKQLVHCSLTFAPTYIESTFVAPVPVTVMTMGIIDAKSCFWVEKWFVEFRNILKLVNFWPQVLDIENSNIILDLNTFQCFSGQSWSYEKALDSNFYQKKVSIYGKQELFFLSMFGNWNTRLVFKLKFSLISKESYVKNGN